VTALPALPAGTNNIGDVDVLTLPATNAEGTALASAARTASVSSVDIANNAGKGLHIIFDVTAVATSDVKVKVEGKDPASGKYYTILEGASVTTITTNIYKVYPGLTAAANLVASDILPKTIRLTVTHANANSTTYSVGYSLI
jgi:ABC-type proline/glycine betaine transport system substrate-binding protein